MNRLPIGILAALTLALTLAGCASPPPISANPVTTATNAVTSILPGGASSASAIQTDLINAEWNLDQGVLIGALAPNDPVDACMHSALTQLGIEPVAAGGTAVPATPSFVPRETGPIDTGAALYILAQEAQKLSGGGITLPVPCKAIVGDLVIKGAANGLNILPGGSLLPKLN